MVGVAPRGYPGAVLSLLFLRLFGSRYQRDRQTYDGKHKKCAGVESMRRHRDRAVIAIANEVIDARNEVIYPQNNAQDGDSDRAVEQCFLQVIFPS